METINKYIIKVENEAHSIAIQNRIFELGGKWRGGGTGPSCTEKHYLCVSLKLIITHTDKVSSEYGLITLNDLYSLPVFVDIRKVQLNSKYTAELKNDHIVVGCQKISNEAFEKLVDAYNRNKKK